MQLPADNQLIQHVVSEVAGAGDVVAWFRAEFQQVLESVRQALPVLSGVVYDGEVDAPVRPMTYGAVPIPSSGKTTEPL